MSVSPASRSRRALSLLALVAAAAASLATSPARWELSDDESVPLIFAPEDSARTAVARVFATHDLALEVEVEATWVGVGAPSPLTLRIRAPGSPPVDIPIVGKPGPGVRGVATHTLRPCSSYPCSATVDIAVERPPGVSDRLGVRLETHARISGKGDTKPPPGARVEVRLVAAPGKNPLLLPSP